MKCSAWLLILWHLLRLASVLKSWSITLNVLFAAEKEPVTLQLPNVVFYMSILLSWSIFNGYSRVKACILAFMTFLNLSSLLLSKRSKSSISPLLFRLWSCHILPLHVLHTSQERDGRLGGQCCFALTCTVSLPSAFLALLCVHREPFPSVSRTSFRRSYTVGCF